MSNLTFKDAILMREALIQDGADWDEDGSQVLMKRIFKEYVCWFADLYNTNICISFKEIKAKELREKEIERFILMQKWALKYIQGKEDKDYEGGSRGEGRDE